MQRLSAIQPEPGRPLYQTARDAVLAAVNAGLFSSSEQMPSTQVLSEQLRVSLVTTHRALQQLVAAGVLHRVQGKGTFVSARYQECKPLRRSASVGLVLERGVSVSEYYHGQILEGVRRASENHGIELILLRFGEDPRGVCDGYIFINPRPGELDAFLELAGRKRPVLAVGARSRLSNVTSVDVDNIELSRRAVEQLHSLGHRRIGFVGGDATASNSRDRFDGFQQACRDLGIASSSESIVRAEGWQLTDIERDEVMRMLQLPDRVSAVFAAGYHFALGVYHAAAACGLNIPNELSVIGVDDPPSAIHLTPSLTTFRQPLVELGETAVQTLIEALDGSGPSSHPPLRADLIFRDSCNRCTPS